MGVLVRRSTDMGERLDRNEHLRSLGFTVEERIGRKVIVGPQAARLVAELELKNKLRKEGTRPAEPSPGRGGTAPR